MLTPRRTSRENRDSIVIHRWGLLKEGRLLNEYLTEDHPFKMLNNIRDDVDVVSFPERAFYFCTHRFNFASRVEVLGLLRLKTYECWLHSLRESQARTLRRAKKIGVETRLRRWDEKDLDALYSLFHETGWRQGMRFSPYYAYSTSILQSLFSEPDSRISIVAYLNRRLVGFLSLRIGELGGKVETMLVTTQRVPGVGNVLIEGAVKELSSRNIRFLLYGHMGFMSGLDYFKIHNGFQPFIDRRYYVPMTHKGAVCLKIGVCSEPWELMPRQLWNWAYSVRRALSTIFDVSSVPDDRHQKPSSGSHETQE